jgi:hypothetical protein
LKVALAIVVIIAGGRRRRSGIAVICGGRRRRVAAWRRRRRIAVWRRRGRVAAVAVWRRWRRRVSEDGSGLRRTRGSIEVLWFGQFNLKARIWSVGIVSLSISHNSALNLCESLAKGGDGGRRRNGAEAACI